MPRVDLIAQGRKALRALQTRERIVRDCAARQTRAEKAFAAAMSRFQVATVSVADMLANCHPPIAFVLSVFGGDGVSRCEYCLPEDVGYDALAMCFGLKERDPGDMLNAALEFLFARNMLIRGQPLVLFQGVGLFQWNETIGKYELFVEKED